MVSHQLHSPGNLRQAVRSQWHLRRSHGHQHLEAGKGPIWKWNHCSLVPLWCPTSETPYPWGPLSRAKWHRKVLVCGWPRLSGLTSLLCGKVEGINERGPSVSGRERQFLGSICFFLQIILQSMHKYKPRVHVMKQDNKVDMSRIQSLPAEGVKTFSFKETEFTTVTAYQNQQVKQTRSQTNRSGSKETFGTVWICTIWIEVSSIKKFIVLLHCLQGKFDYELCGSCVRKESRTKC